MTFAVWASQYWLEELRGMLNRRRRRLALVGPPAYHYPEPNGDLEVYMVGDAQLRKLATIVALDVAGYSGRTEADEARSVAEIAGLRSVIEDIAARYGGRLFNTAGDGFMLEFPSSREGVEAGIELAWRCEPKVRVGVHLGDVAIQPNGDLLGHGVNVAARLMARAAPGSALISVDVYRTLQNPLAQRLHSRGILKLDKMAGSLEVFVVAEAPVRPQSVFAHATNRLAQFFAFRRRIWLVAAGTLVIGGVIAAWALLGRAPQAGYVVPAPAAVMQTSVAVLPFENMSPDKDADYFAAAIQDEILTRLTKIGALKVISRTSTAHYASRPDNLPEIARLLGVANILEGSVQKNGNAVHINVQLIQAASDTHLWAETYDRKLDNIFEVEGTVAASIAEALSAKVTGDERRLLMAKLTLNQEAYDNYLRGLAVFRKNEDMPLAQKCLEEAVRLDPNFAAAWALLSRIHAFRYFGGDTEDHRAAARVTLAAATRLQPDLDDVIIAQGYFQYYAEQDFEGASVRFEQLLAQWPNNADVAQALGFITRRLGRWDKSAAYFARAITLDPLAPIRRGLVVALYVQRKFLAAQRAVEEATSVFPDDLSITVAKVDVLEALGRWNDADAILGSLRPQPSETDLIDEITYRAVARRSYDAAISLLRKMIDADRAAGSPGDVLPLLQLDLGWLLREFDDVAAATPYLTSARDELLAEAKKQPNNSDIEVPLARVYCYLGDRAAAIEQLDRAASFASRHGDQLLTVIVEEWRARIFARFGDKNEAIPLLARLLQKPSFISPQLLRGDPDFNKLRGDRRFEALEAEDIKPR